MTSVAPNDEAKDNSVAHRVRPNEMKLMHHQEPCCQQPGSTPEVTHPAGRWLRLQYLLRKRAVLQQLLTKLSMRAGPQ